MKIFPRGSAKCFYLNLIVVIFGAFSVERRALDNVNRIENCSQIFLLPSEKDIP
jgi:hypothetical protein